MSFIDRVARQYHRYRATTKAERTLITLRDISASGAHRDDDFVADSPIEQLYDFARLNQVQIDRYSSIERVKSMVTEQGIESQNLPSFRA